MLPTPSTSHVDFSHIYEPAEDSYLLLDTLSSESEKTFFRQHFSTIDHDLSPPLVLEVGTGSGVVIAFAVANALEMFGRSDIAALGVDINAFACKATRNTAQTACTETAAREKCVNHAVYLDSVAGDLTASLRAGSVDVLIFNPPYVPTEDLPQQTCNYSDQAETLSSTAKFERDSHLLALSYAGGQEGMETTNRLFEQVPSVLSPRGVAYILLCAQNKPQEVRDRVRWWAGEWSAEIVATSGNKAGWERLCILRIWRKRSM